MKLAGLAAIAALSGMALFSSNASQAAFVMYLDDLNTAGIDVVLRDDSPVGTPTANKGTTTNPDSYAGLGTVTYL